MALSGRKILSVDRKAIYFTLASSVACICVFAVTAPSALATRAHLGHLPSSAEPSAIAVDTQDDVWTATTKGGTAGYIFGLTADNGKVYATDTNNGKIDFFSNHTFEMTFGYGVTGLAVDTSTSANAGDIYSSYGASIVKLDPSGNKIGEITSANAEECFRGTGFSGTWGVAVSSSNGDVYTTDPGTGKLIAFSPSGHCLFQASAGFPLGVAVAPNDGPEGTVFVGNRNTGKIVKINAQTGHFAGEFGEGLYGSLGMATDPAGDVFVVNEAEKVVGWDPNGNCLNKCNSVVPAVRPQGVGVDPATGHLLVAEHEGSTGADISEYELGNPTPLATFGAPEQIITEYSPYPANQKLQEWTGEGHLDCNEPIKSLAVDGVNSSVYASDACSGVAVFHPDGTFIEKLDLERATRRVGFGQEAYPLAIDNSGSLVNGRIYVLGAQFPLFCCGFNIIAAFEADGAPAGFSFDGPLFDATPQHRPVFNRNVAPPYIEGNYLTGAPTQSVAPCSQTEEDIGFVLACYPGVGGLTVGERTGDVFAGPGPGGVLAFEPTGALASYLVNAPRPLIEDPASGNFMGSCAEYAPLAGERRASSPEPSLQNIGSLPCSNVAVFDSTGHLYADNQIYGPIPKTVFDRPTEVSPTSGRLNATLTPTNGEPITACSFKYGLSSSNYTNTLPCEPEAEPYGGETQVHVTLTGLTPETTYHYRLSLRTASGFTFTGDQAYTPHHVIGLETDPADEIEATGARVHGSFVGNGEETHFYFEYGPTEKYGQRTSAPPGQSAGSPNNAPQRTDMSAAVTGLVPANTYHYRVVAENPSGISHGQDRTLRTLQAVPAAREFPSTVHSESAVLNGRIDPGGAPTSDYFEYGLAPCSEEPDPCTKAPATNRPDLGGTTRFESVSTKLEGLQPGTIYHYRTVATNKVGTRTSTDGLFATFPYLANIQDTCPNVLSREQTAAALALDCRSYELVSAANAGGYDVESSLVPGQTPFGGYPQAGEPPRVLYGVHDGGIPGTDHPTNRGIDPYVATRGKEGWSTAYVGIPANNPFAGKPFSSTPSGADSVLDAFAFGGAESCSPCFEGGYTGIPVRLPDGRLVQGMSGPENPGPGAEPDGYVAAELSGDGQHFIFGSTSRFAPGGSSGGDVSIYDHNLRTGDTRVVSNTPGGEDFPEALPCLQGAGHCNAANHDSNGISELAISNDGSHIVLGQKLRTDAAGNVYWHLYMEVNDAIRSIDLTPGTTGGVLFDGMTEDGSQVFFTTSDRLLPADTDESADIYGAEVGAASATLRLVSAGESEPSNTDSCEPVANKSQTHWNSIGSASNCDALAIGGGGGVTAGSGDSYFLSPENLTGGASCGVPCSGEEPVPDQPNLYLAQRGSSPRFIATLDPNDPLVLDSLHEAEKRHTADFQTSPNGRFAAFGSDLSLTGYENLGFPEVFRYESSTGRLDCSSCNSTNAAPVGGSRLASNGLSLTDLGQVFFNSDDILALRDTDGRQDVYEWEPLGTGDCQAGGPTSSILFDVCISLISSGQSPFDSSLLSAGADGTDAYFFTHDSLAPQDHNGPLTKIYDARTRGGFFLVPEPPPCAASDECHGAGSPAPGPAQIGTAVKTSEGNGTEAKRRECKKGFVKRRGKCVKHSQPHRHHRHRGKRGHRHG